MVANAALMARVTDLVALFNRKSLDLPDGLFDRQTQFLLNGTPFEAMLGRSPSDPLVLMIARGPAGYRFAIKALQHAIPDARVEIGEVEDTGHGEDCTVPLWLSGQLRGTRSAVDVVVRVSIGATDAGTVTRADARIDPVMLEAIREARLRE
jgi:hypothetical protein